MKVLGISMGRKNERSDIYCKQVLKGAEAAGAESRACTAAEERI